MEKKILTIMVVLIAFVLLLQVYQDQLMSKRQVPFEGESAPDFQTQNIDGSPFSLKDHLGQKVILLNFWATWCGPCREEMPILNLMQKRIGKEKFIVIGVMEDDEKNLASYQKLFAGFTKKIPVEVPVVVDEGGRIANLYRVRALPESYIIDLDGRVVGHHVGSLVKYDAEKYEAMIKEIILKASGSVQ